MLLYLGSIPFSILLQVWAHVYTQCANVHKAFAHPVTWSAVLCFPLRHGAATRAVHFSSYFLAYFNK